MHETIATIRDIFIILLALVRVGVVVLLDWLILEVRGLLRFLRDEIKPILDSPHDTFNSVRCTTSFVSKIVIESVVNVSSYLVGLRAIIDKILVCHQPTL